jgi:two-component system response regulator LytT
MISIALCDDETKYLDFYETKINEIANKHHLLVDIIRFKNGESLLFYLEDNPNKFEIIYLDILIGGMTGIETAMQIRKFNEFAKIIFLTSTESFVYNAFEAKASNYLIKSLHDDKFETVFLSTVKSLNRFLSKEVIRFKSQQEEIAFNLSDITHFESFKRLVIVNTSNKEVHEFYYKLSDLIVGLQDKGFILTHRSYLVNLAYIKTISTNELTLKNNVIIPISRNLLKSVKQSFIEYLNK